MSENNKVKLKIIITFSILFLVISTLLILIFSAGKKTYVVTYDLNGGTLISGSLEQHITQGQNATPPVVVKDGAYLHSWSESSNHITKDMTISAVWEYKTSDGIAYKTTTTQNYAEISGAYKHIRGEIYLGAYYGDKKIIGICEKAFLNCEKITKIYLLDGLIAIEDSAFSGCTSLSEIEIPKTVTHLGNRVFLNCSSLEALKLNDGLIEIGAEAFQGCSSLKEVTIPSTVKYIGENAFGGIEELTIFVELCRSEMPKDWAKDWSGSATVIWLEEDGDESCNEDESETDISDTEIETESETETELEEESETVRIPVINRPIKWPERFEPSSKPDTETEEETETEIESETETETKTELPPLTTEIPTKQPTLKELSIKEEK